MSICIYIYTQSRVAGAMSCPLLSSLVVQDHLNVAAKTI